MVLATPIGATRFWQLVSQNFYYLPQVESSVSVSNSSRDWFCDVITSSHLRQGRISTRLENEDRQFMVTRIQTWIQESLHSLHKKAHDCRI